MNVVQRVLGSKIGVFSVLLPRLAGKMNMFSSFSPVGHQIVENGFLLPKNVTIVSSCGLKIKGQMRLRCKDCYYLRRDGRLYVMCHSFPRHKQTHLVKREKYTWIFSHACQSKLRPY